MRVTSSGRKFPIHVVWGACTGAIFTSPLPGVLVDFNKEDIVKQFFLGALAWLLVAFLIGAIVGWVIKMALRARVIYASHELRKILLIVTCLLCVVGITFGFLKSGPGKLRAHEEHIASVAAAQAVAQKYQADARVSQAKEAAKLKDEAESEVSRFTGLTPGQREAERVAALHGAACKAALAEYAKCEAVCGDRYVSCVANLHGPADCGTISLQGTSKNLSSSGMMLANRF